MKTDFALVFLRPSAHLGNTNGSVIDAENNGVGSPFPKSQSTKVAG
jgi:hypothetical protein